MLAYHMRTMFCFGCMLYFCPNKVRKAERKVKGKPPRPLNRPHLFRIDPGGYFFHPINDEFSMATRVIDTGSDESLELIIDIVISLRLAESQHAR